MEINQIAQLLEDIEQKARRTIVEINGVYILKDDEPKYRALLALKEFLGRNESVIRELNVLAKAAGVETAEIMATYAAPEVAKKENIQVGLGDPAISVPTSEAAAVIEPVIPTELEDDLKKKSTDLGPDYSGATVGEPSGEEIMPEMPEVRDESRGSEKPTVSSIGFGSDGFAPLENDFDNFSLPALEAHTTTEDTPYTYRAMTDEEIKESIAKIALTDPKPKADSDLGAPTAPGTEPKPGEPSAPGTPTEPGTEPKSGEPAASGTPTEPGTEPKPGEPAAPGTPTEPGTEPKPGEPGTPTDPDLDVSSLNPKTRKVVSRRLHNWRDKLSNDLCIIGAIFFGKRVSSDSYGIIDSKIGYLRAELAKGNEVTDSQVEDLHNSIVEADLTASEKKSLYKKLGRLDKKIEKFNERKSGESRKRGR